MSRVSTKPRALHGMTPTDFDILVGRGVISLSGGASVSSASPPDSTSTMPIGSAFGRGASDEAYVLDLLDEILGENGVRQKRFDCLLGDPGKSGRRVPLPVDCYWPRQHLIVEYRERQHDEATPFFDKPNRLTVSGRGEQRRLTTSAASTQSLHTG